MTEALFNSVRERGRHCLPTSTLAKLLDGYKTAHYFAVSIIDIQLYIPPLKLILKIMRLVCRVFLWFWKHCGVGGQSADFLASCYLQLWTVLLLSLSESIVLHSLGRRGLLAERLRAGCSALRMRSVRQGVPLLKQKLPGTQATTHMEHHEQRQRLPVFIYL